MEEKTPKNQSLLLISVLALLASIVIVIVYVVPKITALKDLSNNVAIKQQELQDGKNKVEALKKATAIIKVARFEMETLGISIPAKENADEAVSQIADAAGKAGLDVESINSSSSQEGSLALVVTSSGSFGNVTGFIENIEKNLRPVRITDYTVASSGDGKVDATINLSVPFLAQNNTDATSTTEGGQTDEQPK